MAIITGQIHRTLITIMHPAAYRHRLSMCRAVYYIAKLLLQSGTLLCRRLTHLQRRGKGGLNGCELLRRGVCSVIAIVGILLKWLRQVGDECECCAYVV